MSTEINLFINKHAYSVQECVSEDSGIVWCNAVWHNDPSKCLQLLAQPHSITSQKTWIVLYTFVMGSKAVMLGTYHSFNISAIMRKCLRIYLSYIVL